MTKAFLFLDIVEEPQYAREFTRNPWMLIGAGVALVLLVGWFFWKRKRNQDRNANPPA